jgi:integrase
MGHADIATTMDVYNESNMERKQERMNKLAKVIGIV